MEKNKKKQIFQQSEVFYLPDREKRETIPLWKSCFPEDSQEFLEYYYTEKTKENRIAVIRKQGEILSMLHRNPYALHIGNRIWEVDYLVAVATAKEHRGKGAMRAVLTKVLEDMNREQKPFTFLMPAAEAIYAPYDFRFFSRKEERQLKEGTGKFSPVTCTGSDVEDAAAWMEKWLRSRFEVYAVRNADYVRALRKELESDLGELSFLYRDGSLEGLLAVWGREKKEQRLLYAEDALCRIHVGTPLMMGRITSVPAFLSGFSLKERGKLLLKLEIRDSWIRENQGEYFWEITGEGSRVWKTETGFWEKDSEETEVLKTDITDLFIWLMGYEKPEKIWPDCPDNLLRTLEQISAVEGVFLDEVV